MKEVKLFCDSNWCRQRGSANGTKVLKLTVTEKEYRPGATCPDCKSILFPKTHRVASIPSARPQRAYATK